VRCPTLKDLPTPPAGKTGWPWTEESAPAPDLTPAGEPWPRISIVTPSYNQGAFLEETIRSVLLQGYPNLEYIVIDGDSVDESVEIIRKYSPWLSYWVTEKDNGQAHAINKGFAQAQGTVFGWLNSDDYLFTDALIFVGNRFALITEPSVLVGEGDIVGQNGEFLRAIAVPALDQESILAWEQMFLQQSCFWSARCWEREGGLDEDLHLLLDVDLWVRFSRRYTFVAERVKLGALRWYPDAKTVKHRARGFAERVLLDIRYGKAERGLRRIEHAMEKCYEQQSLTTDLMKKFPLRVLRRFGLI